MILGIYVLSCLSASLKKSRKDYGDDVGSSKKERLFRAYIIIILRSKITMVDSLGTVMVSGTYLAYFIVLWEIVLCPNNTSFVLLGWVIWRWLGGSQRGLGHYDLDVQIRSAESNPGKHSLMTNDPFWCPLPKCYHRGNVYYNTTVLPLYKGLEGTAKCCLLYQVDPISGIFES